MTLIKSISGIRGTIGGKEGENLSPHDIVKFTSAYHLFLQESTQKEKLRIVIGRDARVSGQIVSNIIASVLQSLGADVIDLGLSTTPTVEMAVGYHQADGGIIITASHNPKEWNALKLLNNKGEFLNAAEGKTVIVYAEKGAFSYAKVENLGTYTKDTDAIDKHIQDILSLDIVDKEAIENANFSIAVDNINSTGGIAIPKLMEALGVMEVQYINNDVSGDFAHNPEPIPQHLQEISNLIKKEKMDVGFVVDPDVDRLAIVMENGEMFGEEYTLVAVADYVLQHKKGNTVSNLSSSRALKDISELHSVGYQASAVGEVNVVQLMKETNAVIGGEGNGGVIYPALHYGRDALLGIALFLSHLAKSALTVTEMKNSLPQYHIAKHKIALAEGINIDNIIKAVAQKYAANPQNTEDGLRIDFEKEWVHLRKSNTEPIIRIYAESSSIEKAEQLAKNIVELLLSYT
jgi:phosphomannomutase